MAPHHTGRVVVVAEHGGDQQAAEALAHALHHVTALDLQALQGHMSCSRTRSTASPSSLRSPRRSASRVPARDAPRRARAAPRPGVLRGVCVGHRRAQRLAPGEHQRRRLAGAARATVRSSSSARMRCAARRRSAQALHRAAHYGGAPAHARQLDLALGDPRLVHAHALAPLRGQLLGPAQALPELFLLAMPSSRTRRASSCSPTARSSACTSSPSSASTTPSRLVVAAAAPRRA